MREVGSEEMSPNSGSKRTRESSTNMATNGVAGGVFPANERHIDGKCILGHLNGKNSMDSRKNGFIHNTKKMIPEPQKPKKSKESFEQVSLYTAIMTYLGFYLLMFLGYINRLFFIPKVAKEKSNREGYAPLYDNFESFYLRYVYRRVRDCWNRPICSVPGAEVVLKDRITRDYGWTFEFTGTQTKCLNLGSYNYLGFAENKGPCADAAEEAINTYGVSTCSPVQELGSSCLQVELEKTTARFLGVDDAIVFGMGFATNALNLPSIVSPGCLVLSDEKNHASLILGLRLSGATIKVFRHNSKGYM